MKKYTITVEVEEANKSRGFINELSNEVADEKRQLAITHKINGATTKLHKKALEDIICQLNNELGKVGLMFENVQTNTIRETNQYFMSFSQLKFSGSTAYKLSIEGIPSNMTENDFKESKYTTYLGEYNIKLNDSIVKGVDGIFDRIRHGVKQYMSANNLLVNC